MTTALPGSGVCPSAESCGPAGLVGQGRAAGQGGRTGPLGRRRGLPSARARICAPAARPRIAGLYCSLGRLAAVAPGADGCAPTAWRGSAARLLGLLSPRSHVAHGAAARGWPGAAAPVSVVVGPPSVSSASGMMPGAWPGASLAESQPLQTLLLQPAGCEQTASPVLPLCTSLARASSKLKRQAAACEPETPWVAPC